MSDGDRRSDWLVILGIGLIVWGAWWALNSFVAPLLWPVRQVLRVIAQVGWPLAVIGLGVLLIVMARRDWRPTASGKRLNRSRSNRMVGGVLAGLAEYLSVDPTLVRVLYALFTLLTGFGPGFLLYIFAMIVMPEEPFSATGVQPPAAPPVPPAAPPVPPTPPTPPSS
jgi:phage shock protein C